MSTLSSLVSSLSSNPYFGAGFGLIGLGTGLAAARRGTQLGAQYLKKKYLVSIEIPHTDPSYYWFLNWMGHRVKTTQQLSLKTSFIRLDNGAVKTKFDFFPSIGNHFFKYNNTWIQVERARDKQTSSSSSNGTIWESVNVKMLGQNKKTLCNLLEEARELALKSEEGKTVIFTSFGPEWRPFGFPRRRRPIKSVILPSGVANAILNDVKEFSNNSDWYVHRGIPYRRGYLLYGPPGCGKSSFIQALAGELQLNICLLNLSERGLTNDRLNHLLTVAPERSVILLEDVDAAFRSRESNTESSNTITFSGLLNALDGIVAAEGRILFMTTNHPERLDPALIRPGRIDIQVGLPQAQTEQIEELFRKFYPEATEAQVKRFASLIPNNSLSMAQLQGFLLLHKDAPHKAIEKTTEFLTAVNKHT
ncbi:mitochondrial chaperone BCS1-like [Schistocerca gregaria]|uniref:mitochondrial chaperone BCS1-like n=1 Tax=Schistocerca gregaria TaxID=7010 RepID=UPI00211E858D|nr:mitochondrial chaperone BCS1-like [Schistocerca gregaria]